MISRVIDLLILIGDEQERLENIKRQYIEDSKLTLAQAFKRIDQKQKGFVQACDIQDFLFSNGLSCNGIASLKFIRHFDFDNDDQLSMTEFSRSLFPQSSQLPPLEIDEENDDSNTHNNEDYHKERLPPYVEQSLFVIIHSQIEFYEKIASKTSVIWMEYLWDPRIVFTLIDQQQSGAISPECLNSFFKRNSYSLYEEQIQSIMLALDVRRNGVSIIEDFVNLLSISTQQAEDLLRHRMSIADFRSEQSRLSNGNINNSASVATATAPNQRRNSLNNDHQSSANGSTTTTPLNRNQHHSHHQQQSTTNSTAQKTFHSNSGSTSKYTSIKQIDIPAAYQAHLNSTYLRSRSFSRHKSKIQPVLEKSSLTAVDFISALGRRLLQTEQLKVEMLSQPDLDATVIFAMFDVWKRGYFGKEEFKNGLDIIGITPNQTEMNQLETRFKLDPFSSQTITFGEFAHILEPAVSYDIPNIFQKFQTYPTTSFNHVQQIINK